MSEIHLRVPFAGRSFMMGNGQSATTSPRRPTNKLSKPKTNSNVPGVKSGPQSRRTSQANVALADTGFSLAALEAELGGAASQEGSPRKRTSIFRTKTDASQPHIDDVDIGHVESLDNWVSRSNSLATDVASDKPISPYRYSCPATR
jgi:hypothetical protein